MTWHHHDGDCWEPIGCPDPHAPLETDACAVPVCGHPYGSHYIYSLNGHDQSRCRDCDPHTNREPGNYEMASDSFEASMYLAADHDYESAAKA